METLKSHYQGKFQSGKGEGASLLNPTTGEVVARADGGGHDLKAALAYARTVGGPSLRKMSFAARGEMLSKMAHVIHENREALIDASLLNGGTTRSDAKFDIDGGMATLAHYAELGKSLGDRTFLLDGDGEKLLRGARFFGYHVKQARPGVAVHINAFNFPVWGLAEKAACALLAGMPVFTKPATSTMLLAHHLMQKFESAGVLAEGVLSFMAGPVEDLLSHLEPFDVLAFTGGSSTAKAIRGHENVVAKNVRVNIEADSLNATVLGHDVEEGSDLWHTFVRHVVSEMTQKAGQKCTATRRIFVSPSRIDALVAAVSEQLSELKVGNPSTDGVRIGPLASLRQQKDAKEGLAALLAGGASVAFGGAEKATLVDADVNGFFIAPTLLRADDPFKSSIVHALEVFAPVSTVMPYESNDALLSLAAKGEGGLVASVYTDDAATTEALALGLALLHGRVLVVSSKTADQTIAPGLVLPSTIHGGPGRAGGGEELGGLRGLDFYLQRTAIQGDRAVLGRLLGVKES